MTRAEREALTARRSADLAAFDLAQSGGELCLLAGIDEAGRGPLFGPVFAGCVVLTAGQAIPGVFDSKQLSEAARQRMRAHIEAQAIAVGIGSASVAEIETLNILGATRLAMERAARMAAERAAQAKGQAPALYLIDAVTKLTLPAPGRAIVKGDALSMAIAAASIIAKVARDELMLACDARYPGYGLAQHKGYGTAQHYAALRALGPTPEHRMSFLKGLTP